MEKNQKTGVEKSAAVLKELKCILYNKMSKRDSFKQTVYEYVLESKVDILAELERISKLQYGAYQTFGIHHTKNEKTHTHICIALRTEPHFTSKSLNSYFQLPPGSKPPTPVKSGRGKLGKLNNFYAYCTDTARHQNQIIGKMLSYDNKFIPGNSGSVKTSTKLTKSAIVFKTFVEQGLSVAQQFDRSNDWNFKTYLMAERDKLNSIITNYKQHLRQSAAPEFPLESFPDTPVKRKIVNHDFTARKQGKKKQSLIVKGDSNLGKTKLCKARFKKPLIIRHMDKLKSFDPCVHDGLIFDDMSFAHYPRECIMSLLDLDDDSDINVKQSMVTIPAGFPRIFTTNRELYAIDALGAYDKTRSFLPAPLFVNPIVQPLESGKLGNFTDPAVLNRFTLVEVTSKLY